MCLPFALILLLSLSDFQMSFVILYKVCKRFLGEFKEEHNVCTVQDYSGDTFTQLLKIKPFESEVPNQEEGAGIAKLSILN